MEQASYSKIVQAIVLRKSGGSKGIGLEMHTVKYRFKRECMQRSRKERYQHMNKGYAG
jgi:hypothetical protein